MTAFACGQDAIAADTCVECGGWLHAQIRGGYSSRLGQVCSEDCAADQTAALLVQDQRDHLATRDLLCGCPVCAAAGHPTAAERQEWADYHQETDHG